MEWGAQVQPLEIQSHPLEMPGGKVSLTLLSDDVDPVIFKAFAKAAKLLVEGGLLEFSLNEIQPGKEI